MTKPFKPLLADTCEDFSKLRYPLLVSPKLDGIRCVKVGGKALSRKLKPIPNDYVREWVETNLPDGIDGELMLRDHRAPFSDVSSAIMKKTGEPDFVFCAFDWLDEGWSLREERVPPQDIAFEQRFGLLKEWVGPGAQHLALVPHVMVEDPDELQAVVDAHVDAGYEGSMVRSISGRYKFGRSTVKEGILLKIKSFVDEEATVIGVVEQMHNTNEATRDNLGNVKRSSAKEGKVGKNMLGTLVCLTVADEVLFEIGSGFTEDQRLSFWNENRGGGCLGKVVKFKHQPPPGGRKSGEAPRFPVFLGWRED